MNFFCTKEHYDQWTVMHKVNKEEIFCLDVHEAMAVAAMLFTVS